MSKISIDYIDKNKENNIPVDFINSINSRLNFNQLKAVTSINGYFLVIAGAGSGKTSVIIYRTLYLLHLNISPKKILIITFTRKAMNEIRERIKPILSNYKDIYIETFHSLAYKFLKKFSKNKHFTIMDANITLNLIKKSPFYLKALNICSADILINFISKPFTDNFVTNLLKPLNRFDKKILINFYEDIQNFKKKENLYNFDDLMAEYLKLLKLNLIPKFFDYIMVDEYQDTDKIQVNILKILSKNCNLMVVGDDYQSIYSFKGGLIDNILNFSNEFKNVSTTVLNINYRSSKPIVELSNEFAKTLKFCFKKTVLANCQSNLKKPVLHIFKTHKDEIVFISNKIKNLLASNPTMTIAILFRNYLYMEYFIQLFKKFHLSFNIAYNPFLESVFNVKNFNNDSQITFSTIHSSKGLEWDYVFIPLLLDGIIPTSVGTNIDIEEEKRLFYVAITRAKMYLYLSYPLTFYNDYGFFQTPSNFIDNISSDFFNIKRN